jgi:hypothetical protein
MTSSRRLVFIVTLVLGSAPAIARAEGNPAEACATAAERARTDFESGKLRSARDGYAACARAECSGELVSECARKRDEVERALPTTAFVVTDAAGRDLDAKVSIDDAPSHVTLGRAIPLDPGVHDVTWLMPDGSRGFRKLTIVEGQKNRLVTLTPAGPAARGSESAGASAPPASTSSPTAPAASQRTVWPWVLVGASAVMLVGAGFLQLLAISEDTKSKERLNDYRNEDSRGLRDLYLDSSDSHADAAKNDQAAAITLTAFGLGALVTGVTWLVVRDRSRTAPVQPTVGVQLGGARFGATF